MPKWQCFRFLCSYDYYLPYRQVHGIVCDTLEFVRKILSVEINSATDNPVSLLLVVLQLIALPAQLPARQPLVFNLLTGRIFWVFPA